VLERVPKSYGICTKHYDLVKSSIQSGIAFKGIYEISTTAGLLKYQADGVYGENAKEDMDEPMVAKEFAN